MQKIGQATLVVLLVMSFAACQGGEGVHPSKDAGIDANVLDDAEVQEDVVVLDDASVLDDAEVPLDGDVQTDAEVQPDADVIPGTLTYTVDSINKGMATQPWWDGSNNEFLTVTLQAGSKAVTVGGIMFTIGGTADGNFLMNMLLAEAGTPIQQTPTWDVQMLELTFPLSLSLAAGQQVTYQLVGRPEWALCETLSFDVELNAHIQATTDDNGMPAGIVEDPASIAPAITYVQGLRAELDLSTPAGPMADGPDQVLLVFNLVSTLDVQVSRSFLKVFLNPVSSLQYIDDFKLLKLWNIVSGPVAAAPCVGNTCDLDYNDNYLIQGGCQDNTMRMTADSQAVPVSTPVYFQVYMPEWEVIDMASGMMYLPSQLPDDLQGGVVLFGP